MDPVGSAADVVIEALRALVRSERSVALATVIDLTGDDGNEAVAGAMMLVTPGDAPVGSLGNPGLDGAVARDALALLDAATTEVRHYGPRGELRQPSVAVFVQSFAPAPNLIIFGAVDFSAALARIAKVLGYRVTVCDARAVFATRARFPMADEVVVEWPDRHLARVGRSLTARDAICVLTHDPKFDVPAIVGALGTAVGYIGAMGSRRTTVERESRLREAGVTDDELRRIMAPIGLDIGARTPAETAISIVAEIVSIRSGVGTPTSLRDSDGPIHKKGAG